MAKNASRGTPALEIKASDGQTFKFATLAEAAVYAARERAKWEWVVNQLPLRNFQQIQQVVRYPLDALNVVSNAAKSQNVADDATLTEIGKRLREYLNFQPAIHDRAPLQTFIFNLRTRSDSEATWTLVWLAYRAGRIPGLENMMAPNLNQPGLLPGLASAWQWDAQSIHGGIQSDALQHLELTKQKAFELHDETRLALEETRDHASKADELVGSTSLTMHETAERITEFERGLETKLNEISTKQQSALEAAWGDLTKTYSETLKLEAPATYWGTKKAEHLALAKLFAWASGAAGVVGALLLSVLYAWLFRPVTNSIIPPWNELLPSLVLAVVFLWLMRTLMRLTMSHVHLSLDAGERQTMVTCYLAMTKQGETSGDERSALFAAIFRPTGDGIVKEEAPPVPLWEMLKAGKPG